MQLFLFQLQLPVLLGVLNVLIFVSLFSVPVNIQHQVLCKLLCLLKWNRWASGSCVLLLRVLFFYLFVLPDYRIYFSNMFLSFLLLPIHIEPITLSGIYPHGWSWHFFLPADSLLPWDIPAQDARCCSSGNWSISFPISANMYAAPSFPTPVGRNKTTF